MPRLLRSSAGVAAVVLAASLLTPMTAAHAVEQVEIPLIAGSDVFVEADFADARLSMLHSSVPVDTTAYFSLEEWDEINFGPAPLGSYPFAVVQAYLYDQPGELLGGESVTTCFDYSGNADAPDDVVVYTPSQSTGDLDTYPSAPDGPGVTCVTESAETRSGFYLLSSVSLATNVDADIAITRVFEPLDIGFGDGDQNGVYLDIAVTNNADQPLTIGLGVDLSVQGVDEKLWRGVTWGDGENSGFENVFTATIGAGETSQLMAPDWPGKTYTFWAIEPTTLSPIVPVATYDTGGEFVPLIIDIGTGEIRLGSAATFAGESVFPGATTTVEASGLNPGETYDLWLTPRADYLTFMLLGAVLADDAIRVGSGTVGATGTLAAPFTVPSSVQLGSRYQLMIGNPATRSWPAGTSQSITIVAPELGSDTVALPSAAEREFIINLDNHFVQFTFPEGTTAGETTASASSTGPVAVGFSLAGNPAAYLHLSTTATFTEPVEVCVSTGGDASGLRLYHYVLVGDSFSWIDITTRYDGESVCGETDSFSPFALGLPDIAVDYTTVEGNAFGFGPTNGTYLSVEITNNGSTAVTVGLGADMMVEGESQPLWRLESWGLDPAVDAELAEGLEFFTRTLEPGESLTEAVPDFPGMTYSIWQLAVDGSGVNQIINSYTTEGLFTPLGIDLVEGWFTLGAEATFAGDSVFPGATTTVEAEGLIPGETYELWLTPGADYFSFMFTGAVLDEDAVLVGSATVNALGRLATAFTVPVSVQVNDSYQLMIGDPATRSWPAGTAYAITIDAADASSTVDGPVVEQLEVSIPLGDTTVLFSFPAGTTDGQTTASLSSTGPAAVGFTMPTSPPVYLHLSTTAEFDGMVEVCVSVPDGTNPAGLSLYHYDLTSEGYVWVDITTRRTSTAVCGETDSFSPFALGIPDGVRLLTKDQCKNGGWATSTLPTFRNQGLCVMYFVRVR